ncbi:MAG: patatin family protein [Eubacterium sp.]|nr:patatin family protein [Eubacterium sp.]
MKKGLVLEGGAMRGMFTAGVTDVMMEHGITFDGMIGVSAGAAFGCNYKSGQIGRVIRYNKRFCREPKFCSIRSWIRTGDLYGAEFCWHTLPEELDLFDMETFRSSPMEFYAVCTDIDSGKAVYHRCDAGDQTDLEWMRASSSMPVVSRPVEIDGRRLLDGGVTDSIPLRFFERAGYERNVVILTQPEDYEKHPQKYFTLLRILLRRYPALLKAIRGRYIRYNRTLDYIRKAEAEGRAFVIRPPEKLLIGSVEHDPEKLEAVYQTGRSTGERCVEEMKAFLEK